jgi:hypothetical protein
MKKHLAIFVSALFIVLSTNAQITIYDGESIIPDFWDIGGNPPNGASSPSGEGWRLNVSGKVDILTEGLVNPFSTGLNTTEKVVRFVRAQNGEGWAGTVLNVAGFNLNIATTNKFSLLVYKEIAGNVTLKLEGAGSEEVSSYYNTPGQWQKLEFTFNAANFSGSPTTMIVMPHNQTPLSETIITYWDEVTMYDVSNNPTIIYNGNNPVSGYFLDGYWAPNGSLNNLMTDFFPNLSKSGINTSSHVMRFLRAKDGLNWCGMGLSGLSVNVATTSVVSLMVNKAVTGRVGVKLEGNGAQEVYADYNTPSEWARLTFTFNSSNFTGNANTLIIFPHFEETNMVNLADHTPMYVDNVILRSASTLSSDYFRSATSGNWANNSSWQSSYNNSDWFSASGIPGVLASSVNIQNGHLITVTDNAVTSTVNVEGGAKLTLNEGKTFDVSTINLQSDATNGTGTFVDKGTFTSTTATVQQYLSSGRNWYIGSPVGSALRSAISTATQVVSYNESNATWETELANSQLLPMKGYIAVSPTAGNITFNGILNTEEKSITLGRHAGVNKEGFHLVANPYPSYVNFASAARTNLSTTMWYRTQNGSNYVFDTFNAQSGVGTSNNNNDLIPVTGDIAPMQAFWVRALAGGGALTFDNSMRSHQNQAVVTNRLKIPAQANQQILRLQVSNGVTKDETILLFNPNATNEYDDYDSPKMSNSNSSTPEIYTSINHEKIVINGLNSVIDNSEVSLGFTTGESNLFVIRATEINNFDNDMQILLRDNELNIETNLIATSSYTFSSNPVIDSKRFSLLFKLPTTPTVIPWLDVNSCLTINNNGKYTIQIKPYTKMDVHSVLTITNLLGQTVFTENLSTKKTEILTALTSGVYIVNIVGNGKTISSKIVLN